MGSNSDVTRSFSKLDTPTATKWCAVAPGFVRVVVVGILASALFVILRGELQYIAPQQSARPTPASSTSANWEPTIDTIQRDLLDMKTWHTKIELAAPTGTTKATDLKPRKMRSLGAFEKMMHVPSDK